MLRFLYTTDLHGDARAYECLPTLCETHGVTLIINGGDMLPKGRAMHAEQRSFLAGGMRRFAERCAARGISFYGLFGNDDLRAMHASWLSLVRGNSSVHDLEERWHELPGGYWIRGNSFVPDYPFGLKDWCLRDAPDAAPVPTRGRAVTSTLDGFDVIERPADFFATRPTLGAHLESLVDPAVPMQKAIMVPHAPPSGLGLGTLFSGEDVGSKSVRAWIERHQPLLTLSGHIHESPDAQRAFRGCPWHTADCGRTTCHQPGQELPHRLTYSIVSIGPDDGVSIDWKQATLAIRA